jgi:uncharacterized glyoxalase superfamily protein PhnB
MNTQTQTNAAAGLRGVVPALSVDKSAMEAAEFYKRAFGARELSRFPSDDGKRLMNCQLEINGSVIMISDCFPERGFPFQPSRSFSLTLIVDDGDAWWSRAVEAGCEVEMPFQRMFWGDRWGVMKDPFGVRWAVDEPAKAA